MITFDQFIFDTICKDFDIPNDPELQEEYIKAASLIEKINIYLEQAKSMIYFIDTSGINFNDTKLKRNMDLLGRRDQLDIDDHFFYTLYQTHSEYMNMIEVYYSWIHDIMLAFLLLILEKGTYFKDQKEMLAYIKTLHPSEKLLIEDIKFNPTQQKRQA